MPVVVVCHERMWYNIVSNPYIISFLSNWRLVGEFPFNEVINHMLSEYL